MPICFNRKEIKDHGEGGNLIGAKPEGKILVVDDVISSGLAIRESLKLLEPFDVEIVGALVTLNRQERGQNSDLMASSELKNDGINVFEIISLDDLLSAEGIISSADLQKIEEYRSHYRGTDV
jgi:orotate phosphoribosyltransferase